MNKKKYWKDEHFLRSDNNIVWCQDEDIKIPIKNFQTPLERKIIFIT